MKISRPPLTHLQKLPLPLLCLAVGGMLFPLPSVVAQTVLSWSGTTNSSWGTSTDWIGGVAPTSSLTAYIADFDQTTYTNAPNAGTTSIAGLQFGDEKTADGAVTLSGTLLTIGASGIVDQAGGSAAIAISSPLALGAAQSWANRSSGTLTVSGAVADGGFLLTTLGTGNLVLSGVLSGTGGLTDSDSGVLTLSGANTYSGTTSLDSGTLTLSGSINSGSPLVLGGGTLSYTPTAGGSTQSFNGATLNAGLSTISNATAGNTVALGTVSRAAHNGGLFNVSSLAGTTTLTVSGVDGTGIVGPWATEGTTTGLNYLALATAANSATSGTVVAYSGATTTIPTTGGSATTNYSGSLNSTQTGAFTANTLRNTTSGATYANGGFTTALNGLMNASGGALTYSGSGQLLIGTSSAAGTNELDVITDNQALNLNSIIANNGSSTGVLVLGGVGGGTITINGQSTPVATGVTVTATAVGSNTATVSSAAGLAVGDILNNDTDFGLGGSGVTITAISGTTITLSGVARTAGARGSLSFYAPSTYSGGTYIDAGTTVVLGNQASSFGTGTVTMAGGTLSGNSSANSGFSNNLVFAAGTNSSIILNNQNFGLLGNWSGSGNVTINLNGTGATSLFLAGDNNGYSGTVTLTGAAGGQVYARIGGATNVAGNNAGSANASWIDNDLAQGGLNLNASVASTFVFEAGSFTGNGLVTGDSHSTVQVGALNLNDLWAGVISGSGTAFTKVGTGTQTFSQANTYTGATTISAGALQIGIGGATGSISSSPITDNASLILDESGAVSQGALSGSTQILYGSAITGTGSLTQAGTGTLTLQNANTYSGGTFVNAGILALGINNALSSSGAVTINGGTLNLATFTDTVGAVTLDSGAITGGTGVLTGSSYTTESGAISGILAGTGGLTEIGPGTTALTGANTYTGGTTITAGTLNVSADNNLGNTSGGITFNGGVLQFGNSLSTSRAIVLTGGDTGTIDSNNYQPTLAGAITGNGNLVITNSAATPTGSVVISGTGNTYSGTTTIANQGSLNLTGSLANSPVVISSGGTLTGTGIVGGTGSNNSLGGGTIYLNGQSNSTALVLNGLTLGNANSYGAGNYSVLNYVLNGSSGGVGVVEALDIGTSASSPTGTLTVNNGGIYIQLGGTISLGDYTLANFGNASAPSLTSFSLSSTSAGVDSENVGADTYTLVLTNNTAGGFDELQLDVTGIAVPTTAYYTGLQGTVWNAVAGGATSWSTSLAGTPDAGNTPGAVTDVILDASSVSGAVSTTLGANTTINSLTVNGNGANTIASDGNTLTINAKAINAGDVLGQAITIGSGANAFTLNAPLVMGNGGANQTYTNASANLFLIGGTGGITGTATAGNTQVLTLVNSGAGGTTINGIIGDGSSGGKTGIAVNDTGSGVTVFSGANTYSGGTTLNGGTLTSAVTGGYGTGFVLVNPTNTTGTSADNATLNSTGSIASTAAVTVNSETGDGGFGIGTLDFNGTAPTIGSLSGNGQVVLNNGSGTTLTVGGSGNLSSTFAGVISGALTNDDLVKAGTGTLTLSGANTYGGTTTISAGVLRLGSASALPTATLTGGNDLVFSSSTSTLDLNGFSITLGAISSSATGIITNGSATSGVSTLTINNGSGTLVQTLTDAGSGQGELALSVTGSGSSLILGSAANNTYTGGTSITGGSLTVTGLTDLGANVSASAVAIGSLGELIVNESAANGTFNNTLTGTGHLLVNLANGSGGLTLANLTAFSGLLEIQGGANADKLVINGGNYASTLEIDGGATAFFSGGNATFANITVAGAGNGENLGAIRLSSNTVGGNISLLGNTTIGSTSSGGTLTGNISTGIAGTSTLTMNMNGTGTSLTGALTNGTGILALAQTQGTTTLSNAGNTYTGATTITGGSLILGNTLAAQDSIVSVGVANGLGFTSGLGHATIGGLSGSSNEALTDNGGNAVALTVGNNNNTAAYSGILSGAGSIIKTGTGSATLSGADTYSGGTTINAGTLAIGNATALGTGAVAVNGGLLSLSTVATVGTNLSVAGGTVNTNGHILTLGGNFTMNSGTLEDGGTTLSAAEFITESGSGTFAITGGTLNLTGDTINYANTYDILNGFSSGSVNGLSITGYDTADYIATLNATGLLSFASVPEPSTWTLLILGGGFLLLAIRRRKLAAGLH